MIFITQEMLDDTVVEIDFYKLVELEKIRWYDLLYDEGAYEKFIFGGSVGL